MIDIHCHILPNIDDGAFSMDESLMMAEFACKSGTREIICTPHSGPYSRDTLLDTFHRFKKAVKEHSIPVKFYLGQEIYLTEHYISQIRDIENGYPVTINGTSYLLVEFSPTAHSRILCDAVDCLCSKGFIPIIAHPERYEAIVEDFELTERLKSFGALLQINKGSLKGMFGPAALKAASYLLYERTADFVASDAHSPYERTPKLREVHAFISEEFSIDYADHLLIENPSKVTANRIVYSYDR